MRKIHQYIIMSAPTTAQEAAIEALAAGEPYVEEMRAEYNRRRQVIVRGFNEMGLRCFEPRGAFYAFPQITSTGLDDNTFSERLLAEEHVAMVPGSAFGEAGRGFVRASYATALPKIEEALERIGRFVARCRS
jgi:aminotransferase